MIHQDLRPIVASSPLEEANAAVILIHGRGGTAQGILDLQRVLTLENAVFIAPQAANNTWYPHSFLAPLEQNEPYLSSALQSVGDAVMLVEAAGIPAERIVIGGFSQGACLASEFMVRNPKRYGGLLVFSGGVIGPLGMARNDSGDLAGTPAFVGCSDVDFHIPLARVQETTAVLAALGAAVTEKIYPGMGHTIIKDEIDHAQSILDQLR